MGRSGPENSGPNAELRTEVHNVLRRSGEEGCNVRHGHAEKAFASGGDDPPCVNPLLSVDIHVNPR